MTPEQLISQFSQHLKAIDLLRTHCKSLNVTPLISPMTQVFLTQAIHNVRFVPIQHLRSYVEPPTKGTSAHYAMLSAHSIRTALIAMQIAQALYLPSPLVEDIGMGALLHDLGKLCVSPDILMKPSSLSELEYRDMKAHSSHGYHLLAQDSWLSENIKCMILKHHERLDGSGYPNGLTADTLSTAERIVALSDVFDAMTSHRAYRTPRSFSEALEELTDLTPTQYDTEVLGALKRCTKKEEDYLYATLNE